MNEKEKIKSTILRQLEYGAACRIHLHRECCRTLQKSIMPLINPKNQRIRICKDMPDSKFDKPFNELRNDGFVRKIHLKTGVYAFYELTEKGREFLNKS